MLAISAEFVGPSVSAFRVTSEGANSQQYVPKPKHGAHDPPRRRHHSPFGKAINTLLTAESLTVMDVLRAASQASKARDLHPVEDRIVA